MLTLTPTPTQYRTIWSNWKLYRFTKNNEHYYKQTSILVAIPDNSVTIIAEAALYQMLPSLNQFYPLTNDDDVVKGFKKHYHTYSMRQ
jgi:hypothetical protein